MTYNAALAGEAAFATYLSAFPDALSATRANSSQGISRFVIPKALLLGLTEAMGNVAYGQSVTVLVTTGDPGAGATVASVTPFFEVAPVELATAPVYASLGWSGVQGSLWFQTVVKGVAEAFLANITVNFGGYTSTNFASVSLAFIGPAAFPFLSAPALLAEFLAVFVADGRFTPDDQGGSVTSQLRNTLNYLAQGIATYMGTLLASVVYAQTYPGTGSGPDVILELS